MLRSERYCTKVDVYSFGIILWERIIKMHSKKLPYSEMTQTQIAVAVATHNHRCVFLFRIYMYTATYSKSLQHTQNHSNTLFESLQHTLDCNTGRRLRRTAQRRFGSLCSIVSKRPRFPDPPPSSSNVGIRRYAVCLFTSCFLSLRCLRRPTARQTHTRRCLSSAARAGCRGKGG